MGGSLFASDPVQPSLVGKRILVTGAGGFIGSHLTERLVHLGASVTAMVRYNALSSWGNLDFIAPQVRQQMTIVFGNVEDSDFVQRIAEGQDIILHLAALIGIPYSYAAPRSYLRTNTEGTLNVLEAVRRQQVGRLVHTSTSEVYGTARHVPIDEDHPLQAQSPYAASKIGADMMAESYARSFGVEVVTLRPFNTYGPRQSARAFIPAIVSQALVCDEVRLGALEPERDMTFVSDTVDGFVRAATADGVVGETINLGSGEAFSVGAFARRILALMGIDKPIVADTGRVRPPASEVQRLLSDNRKASAMLGWEPRVDLDVGLEATIAFVRDHLHVYRPGTYGT